MFLFEAEGLQPSAHLAEQDIGHAAGVARGAGGGFKAVGKLARCGKRECVLRIQIVLGDHPRAAGFGQLGKLFGGLGQECGGDNERRQVGLGEVAIVVRLLLGAHGISAAFSRVPEAAFLHHAAAGFDDLDLALNFIFQSRADEAEAVDILDFGFGSEFVRALQSDADVGVAAQRSLLHVAVGDAGVEENFFQAREVFEGFVGGADVGLGDNLNQRSSAAVEVEIGAGSGVGKPVVEALAGVFFHVQPGDADALHGAVRCGHLDEAVLGDGLVELRYLIALWQVGIEIVLACEDGALADLAADGQGGERGELDGLPVQNRQRAGQPQADRADVGVGRRAKMIGATAKSLGRGEQLDVDFESNDGLVLGQDFRSESSGHIEILARHDFPPGWFFPVFRKEMDSIPACFVSKMPGPSIGSCVPWSSAIQAASSKNNDASSGSSE